MRLNIILNDKLVDEALKCSHTISTKRELIETALKEYVGTRKRKNIKDLRGKILFRKNYDYKAIRN
jgi:Arc/MetJ family transcription regulator